MQDGLIGAIVLFVIAGGGIIAIDSLIIRRLRRQRDSRKDES